MTAKADACECPPTEEVGSYPEIDAFCDTLPSYDGALIPVMHKAQEEYGWLSRDVLLYISRKLGVPASKVYGVATFYSLFNLEPKGKFKINVCLGTACYVRGAENVLAAFEQELGIKNGEMTGDGLFNLGSIRCVGACGLAPVVMVNDRVFGNVKPEDAKSIIDEYLGEGGEAV
ncbi:MAG: NAD(P)H-dependent oxidoreductase subunit E [Clostridiales bacterium]|jgi:NADH-quinone oxidoreductase E subunit|nr:NAD(P)H-dependent oxidoreductase subunit E [Clostridiales bacterium]